MEKAYRTHCRCSGRRRSLLLNTGKPWAYIVNNKWKENPKNSICRLQIYVSWEGLFKPFLNNCRFQGIQVQPFQLFVSTLLESGRRPKLSPLDERKLVGVFKNNPGNIKALGAHELKVAGHQDHCPQWSEFHIIDWEGMNQDRSLCYKTDTFKLTKICSYQHEQAKFLLEKGFMVSWDKDWDIWP